MLALGARQPTRRWQSRLDRSPDRESGVSLLAEIPANDHTSQRTQNIVAEKDVVAEIASRADACGSQSYHEAERPRPAPTLSRDAGDLIVLLEERRREGGSRISGRRSRLRRIGRLAARRHVFDARNAGSAIQ